MADASLRFVHKKLSSPFQSDSPSTAGAVCSRKRGVKRVHGCRHRMRSTARISRKTSEMLCERGPASTGVPCTRKRSIDQVDGSLERGVYIQICSIEQVRVRGHTQGRLSLIHISEPTRL